MFGVLFGSVMVVVGRMQRMAVGDFGMMGGFLVIAGLGVFCRFPMMLGGMLVVVRRLLVVLVDIVTVHGRLPGFDGVIAMSKHRRER